MSRSPKVSVRIKIPFNHILEADKHCWIMYDAESPRERKYFSTPEKAFIYLQDYVVRTKKQIRTVDELIRAFASVAAELRPAFIRVNEL